MHVSHSEMEVSGLYEVEACHMKLETGEAIPFKDIQVCRDEVLERREGQAELLQLAVRMAEAGYEG